MKVDYVASSLPLKLVALGLVLACATIGVLGLLLPIVPGVLFLAIAALIATRHFPAVAERLRANRTFGRHMAWTDRFAALPLGQQVRVAGLVCAKLTLEGIAATIHVVRRLAAWK
jgi:uncharacterized membrane protein YbaN (DUF454 family)